MNITPAHISLSHKKEYLFDVGNVHFMIWQILELTHCCILSLCSSSEYRSLPNSAPWSRSAASRQCWSAGSDPGRGCTSPRSSRCPRTCRRGSPPGRSCGCTRTCCSSSPGTCSPRPRRTPPSWPGRCAAGNCNSGCLCLRIPLRNIPPRSLFDPRCLRSLVLSLLLRRWLGEILRERLGLHLGNQQAQ